MSEATQQEGWWLASDGRWYPPTDTIQADPTPTGVPAVEVAAPRAGAIMLNATTVVPGLVLTILGVVIAMAGLAPWFTFLGIDVNGFRGDLGDTDGWILGLPGGWFLVVGGTVVLFAGLMLVLAPDRRVRRVAALAAVVVPVLTAMVIVAERFKMHAAFDDAMQVGPNDQFSFSFGDAFELSDAIGLWLGIAACVVAAATAVWSVSLVRDG